MYVREGEVLREHKPAIWNADSSLCYADFPLPSWKSPVSVIWLFIFLAFFIFYLFFGLLFFFNFLFFSFCYHFSSWF